MTAQIHPFKKGERYRVVKSRCALQGMRPVHGRYRGWARRLPVSEVITCRGTGGRMGAGVPFIKWKATCDDDFGIAGCKFLPSRGSIRFSGPDGGCLEFLADQDQAPL